MSEKERNALEPPVVDEKREEYLARMAKMLEDQNRERDARETKRIEDFMRKGEEDQQAKAKAKEERRLRMEKDHIDRLNVQMKLQREARRKIAEKEEKFAQIIIQKDTADLQRQNDEEKAVREKCMGNWRLLDKQIASDMERKLAFDMMSPSEEKLNRDLLRRAIKFEKEHGKSR